MVRKLCALFAALICGVMVYGQTGQGTLQGKVTDKETGEPLPFVNVAIYKGDKQIKGTTSDFDGKFTIKPIEPGPYDVQASFVGYTPFRVNGVVVRSNVITFQDLKMNAGLELDEVEIIQYKKPLITKDGGASGGSVTSEEINKMPTRSATGIAATVGGVSTAGTGGGISIRGARTDGDFIYIDGVKVRGSSQLPKSALQEVNVITGGIPANFGDATGGIISITTRGPASEFNGGLELITSGFKVGDNQVNLLDKFGTNILEAGFSGPLIRKREADGSKGETILGFNVSANYTANADGRQSVIGHNVVNDEKIAELQANPISRVPGSEAGVNYNSNFLRDSDVDNVATSRNTSRNRLSLNGKLTFDLGNNMDLSVGGRFNYDRRNVYSLGDQLINWENNPLRTDIDYAGYARFAQRFANDEESESLVRNVYYSVLVDYSKESVVQENRFHGDDYFKYGYNGKYTAFKDTFQFEENARIGFITNENGDTTQVIEYFRQNAVPGDTLITFERGTDNEVLSSYVEDYFNTFPNKDGVYENFNQIQGFRNGDGPNEIYGLFDNYGMPTNSYQKVDNDQYRISASGSADIGDHAVMLGVEYEQRVDRNWALNNLVGDNRGTQRINNIWSVMRSITNNHISELDEDSTLVLRVDENQDSTYYAVFGRNFDRGSQSTFDRNLRTSLGLDPNGTDFIDLDQLDPSQLSLDYFSADGLLNNGVRLVTHQGFDVYGNKFKGTSSVNDYFTATDANGDFTRPLAAYQPVYMAGYVLDKFTFDDIIFNVGLRVDRFDANQSVLTDPYLFREAYTAGDYRNGRVNGFSNSEFGAVPEGISDDAYVYVDDIQDPSSILGYREGKTFFNALGQVTRPDLIRNSSGEVAPLLTDRNDDSEVNQDAFEDYKAQVNFMPRVAFSFPISDEALFFAHYDILTRRPFGNNNYYLPRYQFIRSVGTSANNPIDNPNLLPEKTIDYAMGFQQAVSKSSALKIEAFYREMRDQIQVFQFVGAYPQDYYSFDNIDFGTVQGLTIEYDLRATGNLTLNVNYTLQFAKGTGSSAGGSIVNLNNTDFSTLRTIAPLNFDQRHRFNARVDFRYGSGKNYNGPVIAGKKILENFGANAVFNVGSGTPYSASVDPNPNNARLDGTINGSRLPWQYTINLQLDKSFDIGKEKEGADGKIVKSDLNLNVFLLVNNLLNTRNVINVYRFTGSPDDDGYLSDARYQNIIRTQLDEQSYRDLYSLSRQNPGNYSGPRTVQLGVRLDF